MLYRQINMREISFDNLELYGKKNVPNLELFNDS